MNNARRIEVYTAQNNGGALTPAQCRRLAKRLTRIVLRRPAETEIATVVELPKREESATVPTCPRCKATGDDPCITPQGKVTKTHKGRSLPVAA